MEIDQVRVDRVGVEPQRVDLSVINGKVVVEDGRLLTVDLGPVIERHNRISRDLVEAV